MSPNCHLCGEPMNDGKAWAEVTFHGFETLRMNGLTFRVHARCLRFEPARTTAPLPPRISDPVAEPEPDAAHDCAAA